VAKLRKRKLPTPHTVNQGFVSWVNGSGHIEFQYEGSHDLIGHEHNGRSGKKCFDEIICLLFHIVARLAFCPALPAKPACVAPPCFSKERNYTKSRTRSGNIEFRAMARSMSLSSKTLLTMWLQKQTGTL